MSPGNLPPHPIQGVYKADDGVIRFRKNEIVQWLLDQVPQALTLIACENFSDEDRSQFDQLHGYSVSGAPHVSCITKNTANNSFLSGDTPEQAEIKALNDVINLTKEGLAKGVSELFGIHPDYLE